MPEEKHTDVNIGIHMVSDAYKDVCDIFVLISGDSDLVPALKMIKMISPKKTIIVYIPDAEADGNTTSIRGAAVELRQSSDKNRILPNNLLSKAQFPPCISDGRGSYIRKPETW
jgi:uncharacterized LabA/DUF88 family protein